MATKTPKEKPIVYNQLVVKAPVRKTYDVGDWRTALRAADMGRPRQLFDLFEDLNIDGLLSDAIDKRTLAVTNAEITFQDSNEQDVPEITDLIDTPAFEELLKTIMQSLFWGRSAGEFSFQGGFDFHPIPAKHISLENKSILLNSYDTSGIPYEGDDHLLVLGKPRNFGLFLKTAPYVIYKRGGFGDYAQWLEIFGMPQRVGKYSSYDPESRKLLEQALEQAGSAPYVVIPKESEVETTNNTGNGNSGVSYNDFRRACNEEILITVLGQTLTTVLSDTGARSTAEVHKEVEEGKNKADMRMCQRVLNRVVLPLLEKRGYPVGGGSFVFPEAAQELSVSDVVQLSDILDIPASYLHDKYSIPVPDKGEPVAKRTATASFNPSNKKEQDEQEVKQTDQEERSLWKRLRDFFVFAPAGAGALSGSLHTINLAGELVYVPDFDPEGLFARVAKNQPVFDPELFAWIHSGLIKAFRAGWGAKGAQLADIGVDYGVTNQVAQTMMETNLFHFSAAKTLVEVQELNNLFRAAPSFADFKARAEKVTDIFNKNWAQTEYNTAFLTAESSATYYRLKEQTDIFPYWEYKTVGDAKVRDEHAALDGLILPANDPRWKKIMPPNGWNCRCYIVPRMRHEVEGTNFDTQREMADTYMRSTEFQKAAAQGWGVNRAELRQVFTANQMYIKKFPGKAAKTLNALTWKDYNLQSAAKLKQAATTRIQKTESAKAWWDTTKKTGGDAVLTDYNNRSVILTADNFKTHTTGKRASRADYLGSITETLLLPDEVWIGGNALTDYYLVKYYTDQVMVVWCKVDGGKVNKVHSWFPLSEKRSIEEKYRSGLLIKKSAG
jgi:SPP1 gp7 family putative phage head morphogenesis protein